MVCTESVGIKNVGQLRFNPRTLRYFGQKFHQFNYSPPPLQRIGCRKLFYNMKTHGEKWTRFTMGLCDDESVLNKETTTGLIYGNQTTVRVTTRHLICWISCWRHLTGQPVMEAHNRKFNYLFSLPDFVYILVTQFILGFFFGCNDCNISINFTSRLV